MLNRLRRLHSRGPTSRGLAVDRDGAMLGPDCVLVRRVRRGYLTVNQAEAAAIQRVAYGAECRPNWLFDQCCRIARVLNEGQVALAQIYGLYSTPNDLDERGVATLANAAAVFKANFNPDEPRVPAGNPGGGQWTTDDEGWDEAAAREPTRKDRCIEQCSHLLERPLPYRYSNLNEFAFHRCVNECMRESV